MKLEDQVVSLELAKRLAELNVPQTGAFVWSRGIRHKNWRVTLTKYRNWAPCRAVQRSQRCEGVADKRSRYGGRPFCYDLLL